MSRTLRKMFKKDQVCQSALPASSMPIVFMAVHVSHSTYNNRSKKYGKAEIDVGLKLTA